MDEHIGAIPAVTQRLIVLNATLSAYSTNRLHFECQSKKQIYYF
jgi:hypothetical protein